MTAARSADKAESGGRVREEVREGEVVLQEEEEAQPRVSVSASSGAPLVSWSASEDESPSDRTVLQRRTEGLEMNSRGKNYVVCTPPEGQLN